MKNLFWFLLGFTVVVALLLNSSAHGASDRCYAYYYSDESVNSISKYYALTSITLGLSGGFDFENDGEVDNRVTGDLTERTFYSYQWIESDNEWIFKKSVSKTNETFPQVEPALDDMDIIHFSGGGVSYLNSNYPNGCSDEPIDCSALAGQEIGTSVPGIVSALNTNCVSNCEVEGSNGFSLYVPSEGSTWISYTFTGNQCPPTVENIPADPPDNCEVARDICSGVCKGDLSNFQCSETNPGDWSCGCPYPDVPLIKDNSGFNTDQDQDGIPTSIDDDIDGDGIPNSEDDDIDGDGVDNLLDPDIDGDGIGNGGDSSSWSPSGTNDNGLGADPDVDNDGVLNGSDPDVDGDSFNNGFDYDIDGDGWSNSDDIDADGDGIVDGADDDADGDGLINSEDLNPAGDNIGQDENGEPQAEEGPEPLTEKYESSDSYELGDRFSIQPLQDTIDSFKDTGPYQLFQNLEKIADALTTEPVTPVFEIPITPENSIFGAHSITVDLSLWEEVRKIIKFFLGVYFLVLCFNYNRKVWVSE